MRFVEYNYSFAKTVPDTDEDMIYYQNFRKTFGEDGNIPLPPRYSFSPSDLQEELLRSFSRGFPQKSC